MSITKILSTTTPVFNQNNLKIAWRESSKKSTAFIYFGDDPMIPTVTLDSSELEKVPIPTLCPYQT